MSCSGENNVVDGNENEFDDVAYETHDDEAHEAGVEDLEVLLFVGLFAFLEKVN